MRRLSRSIPSALRASGSATQLTLAGRPGGKLDRRVTTLVDAGRCDLFDRDT
jgi:hypothetical protein